MKRNQRYESRLEKRKQNRFLNIAIGLVVLLIVVVGFNLFSGDEDATTTTAENEQTTSKSETKDDPSIEMETEKDEQNNDGKTSDEAKEEANSEGDQAEDVESETKGGGPEGPWEPVGTSQSEPHQKSYDDQSQDWKEMVQALSYATNIPEDQMTIFWLGNGGGPDLSKGTVSSKVDKVKYDVQLQWIPEKGWKPTSVTKVQ
ncbi:YrrS family protein [Fictibacillus nanhaiensis]|uniref:YrrS family protein n=1 Tax=Fictibacillus nanhaiensis TaxID=742169 RepID=UPI001C94C024|nr:YrrS family protein [Fictibacillus nanhaiensis]MBY6035376.1 YrrS family protein [Fictibacillus nanhaiensis]